MEEVLDLYQRSYDPEIPLLCMTKNRFSCSGSQENLCRRFPDTPPGTILNTYETERPVYFSSLNLLTGGDALVPGGKEKKKTGLDEVRELLVTDYPNARKIILVCDNLNTHTIGAFYEAFPPEEASILVKRLEIHNTPLYFGHSRLSSYGLPQRLFFAIIFYKNRIPDKSKPCAQ